MASYHMRTDMGTGEMVFIGKSGRVVAREELAGIEARAAAGDAAARAVQRDLDYGVDGDGRALSKAEMHALAAQSFHDCPDCAAARARGEVPMVLGPEELAELAAMARRGAHPPREWRRKKIAHADRRRKIARAARAANRGRR